MSWNRAGDGRRYKMKMHDNRSSLPLPPSVPTAAPSPRRQGNPFRAPTQPATINLPVSSLLPTTSPTRPSTRNVASVRPICLARPDIRLRPVQRVYAARPQAAPLQPPYPHYVYCPSSVVRPLVLMDAKCYFQRYDPSGRADRSPPQPESPPVPAPCPGFTGVHSPTPAATMLSQLVLSVPDSCIDSCQNKSEWPRQCADCRQVRWSPVMISRVATTPSQQSPHDES